MKTMNKKRITFEDRILIDQLLRQGYKLKDISRAIEKFPSTVSREIKNRRTSNDNLIPCSKTNRFPFVCSACSSKYHCRKKKFYYYFKNAQKNYNINLRNSRRGIDMSVDEIEYWNSFFIEKLKNQNQPTLHLFNSVKNEFPKSLQSFYNYINKGYFSGINNEMLPRAFNFKPRKKRKEKKVIYVCNSIKKGRLYNDFIHYCDNNKNVNIIEMDVVIGKADDTNAILTLFFRNEKLMLMFLIRKYQPSEITRVFNHIKEAVGTDNFKRLFEVILTDNGWEFSKPQDIEFDCETGEKLINLFYCNSYSSWQKGGIERNHEFIRYIIPKGLTFDNLTQKNVINMQNHINNVCRKSINFKSPYELFLSNYGEKIAADLKLQFIHKNDVTLRSKILK